MMTKAKKSRRPMPDRENILTLKHLFRERRKAAVALDQGLWRRRVDAPGVAGGAGLILKRALLGLVALVGGQAAAQSMERSVQAWPAPYDYSGTPRTVLFKPLTRAARPWRICASYPHLKDAYWISVNYGMVDQAQRTGIQLAVTDAGGYPNTARQVEQIDTCSRTADALIVGAVSYAGLSNTIRQVAARIPVIAAVNDMEDVGLAAKVGSPWTEMGSLIGELIAQRHPAGTPEARIAWFPGPVDAGWTKFVDVGFKKALTQSAATISIVKRGDTGFAIQSHLVEEALESREPVDYIVGSAVTADAAVSVLRERGRTGQVVILADYFTHGTYRAIKRGKALAAPTDFPVMQGRMAIDQAIRALEGTLENRHIGPSIVVVDKGNIDQIDLGDSLAPGWFEPRFAVP